ncbi:tyrosine-type recombinase/integrase [Aureispira anguillae]|uniref:Site-specific integrase n=1 Tax=Aureispira anguillae TaxID=2864201 RepID=A0A915YHC2_9BACT|nr:site-specific integrase [Aureispira anguillae]BDS13088.1 site-specific integrase [Aureispira anguillae]
MIKKSTPKIYTGKNSLSIRWFVYYLDEKGKRIKKYGDINKYSTLKGRKAAAQRLVDEILQVHLKKSNKSLSQKIYDELENRKPTWRPKTYQCKKSKIDIFLKWMQRKKWTEDNVYQFFFEYLTKEKRVAPTTYNDYIRCITQALGWCDQQQLMEAIEKRKASPTPAAYFTQSQRTFLSNAIKNSNPNLWFFVQFVYYCFLRPRAELRLLKVGDVILEEQKILVPANIAKNKKQQYVAIPNAFFPTVEKKIRNRNPNEYLFPGNHYLSPTGMNTFGRQHRELLKELGFDTSRYKLYSWKHTGAVAAVKAGIHIKQLQIQLRHHSLDQVDEYLRQLGVSDLGDLRDNFPCI